MAVPQMTDEYVTAMLIKDAKDSAIKYSAIGMDAFFEANPINKPKPNTRFLRNIIQETDSHNAALLAKETAESRARLRDLEVKKRPGPADIRSRQLGQISNLLASQGVKRKRERIPKNDMSRNNSGNGDKRHRSQIDEYDHTTQHRKYSKQDDDNEGSNREPRSNMRGYDRHERRSKDKLSRRSRSPSQERRSEKRHSAQRSHPEKYRDEISRDRHVSSRRREDHKQSSHNSGHRRDRLSSPSRSDAPSSKRDVREKGLNSKASLHAVSGSGSESDPLEAIVRPLPVKTKKVRPRGRGFVSSLSGINSHFAADYDPSSDVALESRDTDDWEQALEAIRDRKKWEEQGASRLRSAGFSEERVKRWKKSGKNGSEGEIEDVRWVEKGQKREWDHGKLEV